MGFQAGKEMLCFAPNYKWILSGWKEETKRKLEIKKVQLKNFQPEFKKKKYRLLKKFENKKKEKRLYGATGYTGRAYFVENSKCQELNLDFDPVEIWAFIYGIFLYFAFFL